MKSSVASVRCEWSGSQRLADDDPEVMNIVHKEKTRQTTGLELIASEVLHLCSVDTYSCIIYKVLR